LELIKEFRINKKAFIERILKKIRALPLTLLLNSDKRKKKRRKEREIY
jgi:hypothetical protein